MQQLPPEVKAKLRSGVAISSYQQCVEELVLNSVDALATSIAVRLDVGNGRVQVVDNGLGITKEQLLLVAERYTTSKCHGLEDLSNLQQFGYRGEALASVRNICLVMEIESRAKTSTRTYSRSFHKGKPLDVVETKEPRICGGTTITVYDLFYALPVRKKALNASLEFERCRQRLEALALIHPKLSFSLRNDTSNSIVLQTHKSNSILGSFTHIFGGAKARHLCEVENKCELFHITGYISKEGSSTKNSQYIYINDRLVLKTKIHNTVNFWLSRSKIGKRKGLNQGDAKIGSLPGSPHKKSEKHGIYVLNILCAFSEYDITFDPTKTLVEFKAWPTLAKCVTTTVRNFLMRENLVNKCEETGKSSDEENLSQEDTVEDSGKESSDESLEPAAKVARRYAAGIADVSLNHSLHSELVKHPAATIGGSEGLDDVLGSSEEVQTVPDTPVSETPVSETPVSETPVSETPCTDRPEALIDTLDIRPSQCNDLSGQVLTLATKCTEDHKSKTSKRSDNSHVLEAKVNEERTVKTEFETLSNSIPPVRLSQLMPTSSEKDVESPVVGVRDRTFLSQSSEDNDSEASSSNMPLYSSLDAFKAAFQKSQVTSGKGYAKVQLTSLQRMRERMGAKVQKQRTAQQITVEDEPSSCGSLQLFKKHSDSGRHKNRSPFKSPKKNQTVTENSSQDEHITQEPDSNPIVSSLSSFRTRASTDESSQVTATLTSLQRLRKRLGSRKVANTEQSTKNKVSEVTAPDKSVTSSVEATQHQRQSESEAKGLYSTQHSPGVSLNALDLFKTPQLKKNNSNTSPLLQALDIESLQRSNGRKREWCDDSEILSRGLKFPRTCSDCHPCDGQETIKRKPSGNDHHQQVVHRQFLTTDTLVQTAHDVDFEEVRRSLESSQASYCSGTRTRNMDVGNNDADFEMLRSFDNSQESVHSRNSQRSLQLSLPEKRETGNVVDIMDTRQPNSSETMPNALCLFEETESSTYPQTISETAEEKEASKSEAMDSRVVTHGDITVEYIPLVKDVSFSQLGSQFSSSITPLSQDSQIISVRRKNDEPEICPGSRLKPKDTLNSDAMCQQQQESDMNMLNCDNVVSVSNTQEFDVQASQGFESSNASSVGCTQSFKVQCWTPQISECKKHIIEAQQTCELVKASVIKSRNRNVENELVNVEDVVSVQPCKTDDKEENQVEMGRENTDRPLMCPDQRDKDTNNTSTDLTTVINTDHVPNPDKTELSSTSATRQVSKSTMNESQKPTPTTSSCKNVSEESAQNVTEESPKIDVVGSTSSCKSNCAAASSMKDLSCASVTVVGDIAPKTPPNVGQTGASKEWREHKDENTGQVVYINQLTGNSRFEPVIKDDEPASKETDAVLVKVPRGMYTENAAPFLSHPGSVRRPGDITQPTESKVGNMISKHLTTVQAEGLEKWGNTPLPEKQQQEINGPKVRRMWSDWENPMYRNTQKSAISVEKDQAPREASRIQQLIHPYTFTTDMFQHIRVLGQMDNKFIACLVSPAAVCGDPPVLIVVDQHAAHERVRLEKLTAAAYEPDSKILKASRVNPPVDVELTANHVRIMTSHRAYFDRIGLRFSTRDTGTVTVQTVPACIVDREDAAENRKAKQTITYEYLEELLKEQTEVVEATHGGDITLPRAVHSRLCSQACHGAIKFGDPLSMSECIGLIDDLSTCKLPFQCAHGRPSMMPLLNMDHLSRTFPNKKRSRPNLWKLYKEMEKSKADKQ